jgi:hypothetical protein
MKEKTLVGHAVAVRLTQSEYAEYKRLGGIKWLRMYLRMNAEIYKTVQEKKS